MNARNRGNKLPLAGAVATALSIGIAPPANAVEGGVGRPISLGLGPAFAYTHKSKGGGTFDVNFRWVFEFDTKNRFEGDGGQITFGYHH